MADQSVEEQNVDNDVVESGKDNGIVDTVKDDGGQEVADNQLKNEGEGKSPGTDWKAEARKWESRAKSNFAELEKLCLLYTSPSPRDQRGSRMPSSA